ncbi:MAG: hypothetical protein QNJ47_17670 [Nostocaceae cyanobacterium]|nr:hypothetical protein [Nostocaceae cyanobacterium]
MKVSLKRIEATLHDIRHRNTAPVEPPGCAKQSLSFRISVGTKEEGETSSPSNSSHQEQNSQGEQEDLFPHHSSVETFPAQESGDQSPHLPKFKTPKFTSHRNAANPAFAMNLLQEIQADVAAWQEELQTIVRQIQDIYLEGPIVNGWLESHQKQAEANGTATLRHAEVDQLMDYVEEICAADDNLKSPSTRAGYRLCALDSAGKVWSRPCPPDQVPSVSMAIARYQKLRQLLGRKQYLETRLSQLAETLVVLHGHIQET